MKISVVSTEANNVLRDLEKYEGDTRKRVSRAVKNATYRTRRFAQAAIRSKTGNLKRRIKAVYDDNVLAGVVRSTAPHAHLVEFGTKGKGVVRPRNAKAFRLPNGYMAKSFVHKGSKPHPYLRPAIDKTRPKYEADLVKAVSG